MNEAGNLWAVVFDKPAAAEQARAVVRALEDFHCLLVDDVAIVTRLPDGSFKFDRERHPGLAVAGSCGLIGFLAGLVVAQPLAGAVVGTLVGSALAAAGTRVGISDEFVREVEALMTPGATVLFVMDEWGDREAVLYQLRGLGGKVLKTNVDPGWAREVQAALLNPPPATAH
ncbi:MAG TPA: DUF1269 domain-containing protein [Gemmataceae bacterium]|nr:DUF1269 domain-containing protein [Gemmataceae bacterium]